MSSNGHIQSTSSQEIQRAWWKEASIYQIYPSSYNDSNGDGVGDGLRPLMIGGGVGIPPMLFLAESLGRDRGHWEPLVLMGSELPFPFDLATSKLAVPAMPDGASAAMPCLQYRWKTGSEFRAKAARKLRGWMPCSTYHHHGRSPRRDPGGRQRRVG